MTHSRTTRHPLLAQRRSGGPRSRRRRGGAALELAILLPLLISIILGCIDLGRFVVIYVTITNAARAGAGAGAMKPATVSTMSSWRNAVKFAVLDELSNQGGFEASAMTIPDPQWITETSPKFNRVQVKINYSFATIVQWPLAPSSFTISRTVEMRAVRP